MKSLYSSLLLIMLCQSALSQGLNFEDSTDYEQIIQKQLFEKVNEDSLPSSVDLSAYLPSIINQKNTGTCIGMSAGYYMRTMLEAMQKGLTDKSEIDKIAFSPSYLYNVIKDSTDDNCMRGSFMVPAFEHLRNKGIARYAQMGFPDCSTDTNLTLAEDSRIMDYITLFSLTMGGEQKINITKKALAESSPVVVGIQTTPSMSQLSFWGKLWLKILQFFGKDVEEDYEFNVWQPEKSKSLAGGHAVCIVGYDDNKFGGAFRVVNSFGEDWGDNGFFWIRYPDFQVYAKYGFQSFLKPKSDGISPDFSGEFFFDFNFPFETNGPAFHRNDSTLNVAEGNENVSYFFEDQKTGQVYRVGVKVFKQAYIYILTESSAEQETHKLFPEGFGAESYPQINTVMKVPGDRGGIRLVEPVGTEYAAVLFAAEPIEDIYFKIREMNSLDSPFPEKLYEVFGEKLIPQSQIDFSTRKMAFEVKGEYTGSVVPMIIAFNQVPGMSIFGQ